MSDYKSKYPTLFSPTKLGKIEIKNRFVFAAHWNQHWDPTTFHSTPRAFNYYKERAVGGVGLITYGNGGASSTSDYYNSTTIGWWKDDTVPGMKELSDMIHSYDCKVVGQLSQAGHFTMPWNSEWICEPTLSASETQGPGVPWMMPVAKEMEEEDIERFLKDVETAAQRIKAADCDGVEFLVGHGKLPNQFMSPMYNKRTDRWGGEINGLGEGEGRARMILEIARHMRKGVGPDYNVSLRINHSDHMPGGTEIEDWIKVAKLLEEDGQIDFIGVTCGTMISTTIMVSTMYSGFEPGLEAPWTSQIKAATNLPVLIAGHINSPEVGERLLNEGAADVVGIARGLIAEPHFVKRIMEDREEDIRPCIRCLEGCYLRTDFRGIGGIRCAINPEAGEEKDWGSWTLQKADKSKKVMIIGAGAAGLECARYLAVREHNPVIYDKGDAIGGQLRMWARMPGHREVMDFVDWQSSQLEKLHVPIHLNTEINEENYEEIIKKEMPDEIVVATGSHVDKTGLTMTNDPVVGWDKPHVFTYEDIFSLDGFDFDKLGQKVLVADLMNDRRPVRVLETLLKEGKDPCFITPFNEPPVYFSYLVNEAGLVWENLVEAAGSPERWNPKKILVETWIAEVTDKGAKLVYLHDFEHPWEEEYDSIVLVPTRRQNKGLYLLLKKKGYKPHLIGDAASPRSMLHVTHEGYKKAREL